MESKVTKIQFRQDSAAAFNTANPILSSGEPGYDTDNHILKVGDGATRWNSLGTPYTKLYKHTCTVGSSSQVLGTISFWSNKKESAVGVNINTTSFSSSYDPFNMSGVCTYAEGRIGVPVVRPTEGINSEMIFLNVTAAQMESASTNLTVVSDSVTSL